MAGTCKTIIELEQVASEQEESMNEKIYRALGIGGAAGIAVGVIVLVTGLTAGIVSIVSGAQLLNKRKHVTF